MDLDPGLLAGLEEDTDLRGLLPWEEKQVGEAWFVDAAPLTQILWPGGAISYRNDQGKYLARPVDQRFVENLDGTLRVELASVLVTAGSRCARCTIRGRTTADAGFEHDLTVSLDDRELSFRVQQDLDAYVEVYGVFDWNIAAHRLDWLYLEGDLSVSQVALLRQGEDALDNYRGELRGKWVGKVLATVTVEPVLEGATAR